MEENNKPKLEKESENMTEPCAQDENIVQENDYAEPDGSASICPQNKSFFFKLLSFVYEYVEIFAVSIVVVLFLFTFCIRLCRVDGGSMNNTLLHNERIVTTNLFYTPKQDDIVVFHLSNDYYQEPIVKRVIATEGQTVEINFTDKVIKVDGVVFEDANAYYDGGEYVISYSFNQNHIYKANGKIYFAATVPEDHIFVLGDNRNGSSDSRYSKIGFVSEDCVLGKAIFRISPFTWLG